MKKALKKVINEKFHFVDGKKIYGVPQYLRGDVSGLRGDVSGLLGEVSSGLWGNVSGLRGNVSDLRGNVDKCALSSDERESGVNIGDLTEDSE